MEALEWPTFDSHGQPGVVRGRMTNGRAVVLDIDCLLGDPMWAKRASARSVSASGHTPELRGSSAGAYVATMADQEISADVAAIINH